MAEQMLQTKSQKWPELEGKSFEEAKSRILQERPELEISEVQEGSPVTMDYRTDRVRIFVNEAGIVVSAPQTG